MVRRYYEPIEVLPDEHGRPVRFIWHGRLYLVLAMLGHWRERRAWWREVLDPAPPRALDPAPPRALDPTERLVWRVEAGAGRLGDVGVYDLALESGHPPGPPAGPSRWQLLRVSD